uniref:Uncharacterized protein n=1 Tax=viral metagenome TaxID=1070528 RepID=A0A6C0ACE8_9ZZZZ
MDYINDLLKNHPLDTDTEFSIDRYLEKAIGETESELDETYKNQFGGGDNRPKGGFPPILICSDIDSDSDVALLNKNKEKEKTKREFESNKSTIKIKDILEKRKETKPFFSLD